MEERQFLDFYGKHNIIPVAQKLQDIGFQIYATRGTANFLLDSGISLK